MPVMLMVPHKYMSLFMDKMVGPGQLIARRLRVANVNLVYNFEHTPLLSEIFFLRSAIGNWLRFLVDASAFEEHV